MKYFEQRLDEENIKSKKVAWFFTSLFAFITIGLMVAIVLMLPLKMTDVKVLIVDKNTGYPTEITSLTEFETGNIHDIKSSDALNKFFSQQYIILHDSYNHHSIRDAYAKVQLYSTPEVFKDYKSIFEPPSSIEQQLGTNKVLEVTVISLTPQKVLTPFKEGENGITMTARITKVIREHKNILSQVTGTVTLTFGYDLELSMDERARNLNPFGFTVTSYRFDPDQV